MKQFLVGVSVAMLLFGAVMVRADEEEAAEETPKKDGVETVIGIDLGTTYSW